MKIEFLIFLYAWIIILPSYSQKLKGVYSAQNSVWSGELTLSEKNRFKMTSGANMGHVTTLSKGYYLKEKDTLILCFERYVDPSPSIYNIQPLNHEKARDRKHKMISVIQIEDIESIHFQMLGYKNLTLQISSLESSLSSVRIILKPYEPVEYDASPRIGKYLIKANKESIELHGIDTPNKAIYVLKRRGR